MNSNVKTAIFWIVLIMVVVLVPSASLLSSSSRILTVTQARIEDGRELITVCFRGRLLDYVLDKVSGKLLLGSLAYPATFQEYWDLERPRGQGPWVLQDIRNG